MNEELKKNENYIKTEDGYFVNTSSKGWCFLPFEKFYNLSDLLNIIDKLKDINSKNDI